MYYKATTEIPQQRLMAYKPTKKIKKRIRSNIQLIQKLLAKKKGGKGEESTDGTKRKQKQDGSFEPNSVTTY